jgi:aryl-alcohol dehydrogenase-like predicted oxidoreductase
MKHRTFGTSRRPISEVGLGCWQFGGDFGPMEDDRAMAIMATAVERGIDFFDTADVYGAGKSESLIGRFLAETEAPVSVATKFGRDGSVYPDRYSEDALRQSVDASRERLGVEVLDCIQLHCIPMVEMQKGDVFDWLRALKDEGAIRDFGASVETVDEGLVCLEQEGLASLQVIFNLFRQKLVAELLPQAKAADVSIIVRLPLASGLLAGKFTKDTTFSADDHRTFNRDGQMFNVGETFAGLPFETGVELTERLRELLPGGITMAQASLRWILDHDAVTTVIPGASSVAQAEGNAAASGLAPFSPELHEALAEFYRTRVVQHIRGPY